MGDCISWCNPVFKRVETLPELDYATRNHAYILPDNKAYILNDNGDGFTELTSSATNVYDDKPLVARVEKLEAKEDSDKQTLSLNDRTITISNGNSITLPEDRDTVYDDAELKRRIQAVESRTDNFVNGVNVSREGNKVKLTYTFVDGTSKEVEFDDKDTITLAYDDSEMKRRITSLENKTDNDNQILSLSGNNLSISGGNTVQIPSPPPYNDSEILNRISSLETRPDNDKQTLSINNRTISISNGNSIELPEETLDGGNNLVCNSAFPENTTGWGLWESPSSQENTNLSVAKHVFYYNNTQNLFVLKAPTNDGVPASTKRFPVKRNTNYSINVILFGTGNIKKVNIYFLGRNQGETVTYSNVVNVKEFTGSSSTTEAIRYHFTFNTGESDEGFIRIDNGGKTDSSQTSDLYFTELDVYEGTSPRTWEMSTNCLKERVALLENKPDNDKQKLSYSNGVLSIENGNSVTVPMSIGKSAYQSWLDTGNTGTEQDFIRSLKGAKGDKGDVTDIGTNALLIYYCDLTSNIVRITGGYNAYKALTYNTKTQLGTVHLDLTPTENSPEAHIIGKLPKDAPKPYSLVEVSVFGNHSDGTGQIYITPEGIIRCNALTKGRRYIVDLLGYYVYK